MKLSKILTISSRLFTTSLCSCVSLLLFVPPASSMTLSAAIPVLLLRRSLSGSIFPVVSNSVRLLLTFRSCGPVPSALSSFLICSTTLSATSSELITCRFTRAGLSSVSCGLFLEPSPRLKILSGLRSPVSGELKLKNGIFSFIPVEMGTIGAVALTTSVPLSVSILRPGLSSSSDPPNMPLPNGLMDNIPFCFPSSSVFRLLLLLKNLSKRFKIFKASTRPTFLDALKSSSICTKTKTSRQPPIRACNRVLNIIITLTI